MSTYVQKANKYGQVEPNKLTAIINGQQIAQAPAYTTAAATTPIPELENGMFLKIITDTTGKSPMGYIAVLPGAAPATTLPFLVFSEKKLYDERQGYSDFVDKASDKADGLLYPRLFSISPDADIFTTNTIKAAPGSLAIGDILFVGDDGYLSETPGLDDTLQFEVVKVYTMPDGQPGVKLLSRIKV